MSGRRIEIVTIGDELLLGFTIDTNAAHLSRALGEIGYEVVRRTTVGDRAGEIGSAVKDALARTGAVITTGGLGPTSDDLSKASVAGLFGMKMVLDEGVLKQIEERWARLFPGRHFPPTNRQQAEIPEGATVLTNRHGSAPGIWIEDSSGRWVAMLPGVPREMRGMLADEVLPRLEKSSGATVILSKTLRTSGIGESAIAEILGPAPLGTDEAEVPIALAFLPSANGVDLRLTVRGVSLPKAETLLNAAAMKLRKPVAPYVYGEDDADLASVVLQICRAKGVTLAVAESCTGGMLGQRLTAIPGSSDVFRGGVIAYDNSVKVALLGVSEEVLNAHGAVSVECAAAMAIGARSRLGTKIGVSITGIAGPDGGTPDKPVGTVCIAIDGEGISAAKALRLIGDREEIRQRSAQSALDMVRRTLQPV
ncbi:MAG: competence/damage-inducible protein A [Gemmatimonadota bacterium]|nr:competence/damage-inducible protein A [Gemmatimonadota bacterium]